MNHVEHEDESKSKQLENLEKWVRMELESAVLAHRNGSKVYQSLKNLNEVIGTEYGDRVLYELIQNAHDAHGSDGDGQIAIELVIHSETEGMLYVANGGNGFRWEDVQAVRNLATSAKEVGEGIGNKGLGFRSIEALTDDVQIYSRSGNMRGRAFDGYCFNFAKVGEIEEIVKSIGEDAETSAAVAKNMPRYLVPQPLEVQPNEILAYARRGYATVIAAPLRTAEAVALASSQVNALTSLDVPLLLFLDRIAEVRIVVRRPDQKPYIRRLSRRQTTISDVQSCPGTRMHEVDIGDGRRFLVVQQELDKQRVLEAVGNSVPTAPQLKQWLNWKGTPIVSVAVGLSTTAVVKGRLYNFLPMGEEAACPFLGYLDAPFFADIDRRNTDLDLPLNATLMTAAAETCAAAVLAIVNHDMDIPVQAVFDLFGWTGDHAVKFDNALRESGSSLRDAVAIPTISERGKRTWSSLSDVRVWPEGKFSILKDIEIAKHVSAQLVSKDLDSKRIERLRAVVKRIPSLSLTPSGTQLAKWSTAFARSLFARKVSLRTWSRFYDDLPHLFKTANTNLNLLDQREVLYDRLDKLLPAGGHNDEGRTGVFVRRNGPKGKKNKGDVPLPPATLTRRFRFLHHGISLRRETLEAFIDANLVREYDPIEALAGLKSVLGKKANDKRRSEALVWAFQVWRAGSGGRLEEELGKAGLYVPTLSGWRPASACSFSASWTSVGRALENYLVEAAGISPDCQRAHDLLLLRQQDWPVSVQDAKRDWARFLELIGVVDGLRPVPAQLVRRGSPSNFWKGVLQKGKVIDGLNKDWCGEVASVSFNHPHTDDYEIKGEVWRLPGQIENDALPDGARGNLCMLIFEFIKVHGAKYFQFYIGRYKRYERDWDQRKLPTPLATFLRSKPWIATNSQDGYFFRNPKQCWGARVRRGGPPRFINRVVETTPDLSDGGDLAEVIFGDDVGLRDWNCQATAVERLRDLGDVAAELSSNDRPTFRSEHRRAWQDLLDTQVALPTDLSLVVTRRGQLEVLAGAIDTPAPVILTEDAQRFEARILSSAGRAVLEVGPDATERVAALLENTGAFAPRRLDGIGVQLLVDGERFVPRASDPLLTSLGLEWLPEVFVIGHELRAEQLERGIQKTTIDRRARAIRFRHCDTMTLVVDNEQVSPNEELRWYAFEHEGFPTIVLRKDMFVGWHTLAFTLSRGISGLIDGRLRYLEPLLMRLAHDSSPYALEAPSDEILANALECDVQIVRDLRAAQRTDLEHILHLLIPVVGYYGGSDLANQILIDVDRAGNRFDARKWLDVNLADTDYTPSELIDVCEQMANRTELRRGLNLDYARFNRVLLDLDEVPLSNEAELRHIYNAYLVRMRLEIIERLRRHHVPDYYADGDLNVYVERKNLTFLEFDKDWILTRESLETEVVEKHVSGLLAETLGEDSSVVLPLFKSVVEVNRKVAREFAGKAAPVIAAWCLRNNSAPIQLWQQGEAQALVRHLENRGFLDFERISLADIPGFCKRADCWPDGMPETLDSVSLELSLDEVEAEENRREQGRQQREVERRSIVFAGIELDTGDLKFTENFQDLAAGFMKNDEDWFERSRQQTRLVKFDNQEDSTGAGGAGAGRAARRRERQLTDVQRQAMGQVSEWLAYQFLSRRHGEYVDEACWVSTNRAHFFGGDEGNDAAGCDFKVITPKVEWLYEVKSSMDNSGEFELTANELRIAGGASKDGRRRYRILYVPYVFSPDKWCVLELPNPMGETTRNRFKTVGRGSVRLRFERQ